MRMRKKKWADPYLQEHCDYAYENPIENKGKWKELLECQSLHVEIGPGKGDYFIGMSQQHEDTGWVAIEKEHNVAAVACKKALEEAHVEKKTRMIVGDGIDMLNWFAEGEIDVIHLNFSDPWPKKYTHKRRLSSERFLEIYRTLLSKDGYIQMKTDNEKLFEDSILYFLHHGYMLENICVNFRRDPHPEDVITEYENRFMQLGQPIYFLIAKPIAKKG